MKIKISTEHGEVEAEIDEKYNPKTARAIIKALPFESRTNVWGKEIYFEIPVKANEENGQQTMEVGDLAYWPTGRAFCIFFGRTPVSVDERPKAYSNVNKFGRIIKGIEILDKVQDGEKIGLEKG